MTDDYKRGLVTGLAMQPLYVVQGGGAATPKPVVWLPFDGSLENKGTYNGASIVVNGADTVYADGLSAGRQSFSATTKTGVQINGLSELLNADFTATLWVKYNDSGLLPYKQYRRIWWFSVDGAYFGVEISYSGSVSTNRISLAAGENQTYRNTSNVYNDGNWHFIAMRKNNVSFSAAIDGIELVTSVKDFSVLGDACEFGHRDYTLNGYIADFRLYNYLLSTNEINAVMADI